MPLPLFPVTPTLDDFERANESPLSFNGRWGELAPEWPECNLSDHSFGCSIGAANGQVGLDFAASVWLETQFKADQEVHCTLTGSSSCEVQAQLGEGYRLFLRAQQIGNNATYDAYEVAFHNQTGGDIILIRKIINGSYAGNIASLDTGIGGIFTWPWVLFRVEGTTLSVIGSDDAWATSSLLLTGTDNAISGAGYVGIGFEKNTDSFMPQIDNVGGGNVERVWMPQYTRRQPWGPFVHH